MNKTFALLLALLIAAGHAWAEEKKSNAKKSSKAKSAAKSDKNVAQKAEASIMDTVDKYNIWKRPTKK